MIVLQLLALLPEYGCVVASSATRRVGGFSMFYVYVLFSIKNKRLYTGYTEDLKQRIREHNNGSGGIYSQKNRPYTLVYYEALLSKKDAMRQEKFYKSGYGREVLKEKIVDSLKIMGA